MAYTQADYERERAIIDRASAYAEKVMREGRETRQRNWLSKDEAAAPEYAACNNAMRGRVEQFEILRDLPERFSAYLEYGVADGIATRLNVQTWQGDKLGIATVSSVGRPHWRFGHQQRYSRAIIGGKEYSWQGQGAGMVAHFRKLKGQ